ncbi:uncharacterized protein LOC117604958 [Osmia lignaria lignaria]|uniref:uncharacterized protein LOC117604958 n=1 Tax=Osmia lignaria lignaria TaxID=1437193 RepID=UPI00402B8E22
MAFVERDLYLKPLLRLKQQEDILEKGLIAAIENIKLDSNLWREVVHEYKEITMKRQNLFNAMYKNMENISTEMESVKHIARHPEEIQNLGFEEILLHRASNPSIQKYENLQKNVTSSGSNKMETKKETQDYKDVHDFHALVALTGHTGNWSMEDHLFFLKMRKKCENVPALVAAIQKKYPDLSVESIVNHESWYKQYENLREKQRAAVTEWRKRKEREKMRNIEQLEKSMNLRESEDVSNEMDKRKRMIVSRKVKSCPVETKRTNESAGSNTAEKKELIRKWRMEKESKRSMDEEQLRMQAKLKREIEGNKRQKRREKIQEALEEYRRKKSFEGASKELNERWKEKYKFDATLIKEFRKQDEEYTKKRRDLIERSKKPSKSETIGIKKMELVDARTYSTFLESTKVWREKCKATSWTNHSDDTRYIKDIPRICIRWRNEESEDLNI